MEGLAGIDIFRATVRARGLSVVTERYAERLAACGSGPSSTWYSEELARIRTMQGRRCNLATWCPSCARSRVASHRQRMLRALGGVSTVELWTLTVPEVGDRRRLLARAWANLRRLLPGATWAAGVELCGLDHWHLHVVVPRGWADAIGREHGPKHGPAPWLSWSEFRLVWGICCRKAAQALAQDWPAESNSTYVWPSGIPQVTPWASTWVSLGAPKRQPGGGAVIARGTRAWLAGAESAVAYAAKYAAKPPVHASDTEIGFWAGQNYRRKRIWTAHADQAPSWVQLVGYEGADLDGAEAHVAAHKHLCAPSAASSSYAVRQSWV